MVLMIKPTPHKRLVVLDFKVCAGTNFIRSTLNAFVPATVHTTMILDLVSYDGWAALAAVEDTKAGLGDVMLFFGPRCAWEHHWNMITMCVVLAWWCFQMILVIITLDFTDCLCDIRDGICVLHSESTIGWIHIHKVTHVFTTKIYNDLGLISSLWSSSTRFCYLYSACKIPTTDQCITVHFLILYHSTWTPRIQFNPSGIYPSIHPAHPWSLRNQHLAKEWCVAPSFWTEILADCRAELLMLSMSRAGQARHFCPLSRTMSQWWWLWRRTGQVPQPRTTRCVFSDVIDSWFYNHWPVAGPSMKDPKKKPRHWLRNTIKTSTLTESSWKMMKGLTHSIHLPDSRCSYYLIMVQVFQNHDRHSHPSQTFQPFQPSLPLFKKTTCQPLATLADLQRRMMENGRPKGWRCRNCKVAQRPTFPVWQSRDLTQKD